MKKIIFTFSVLSLLLYSCKDNNTPEPADLPFNPFDTLTYPLPEIETIPVDSNGFLGLHHYIFSESCNRPGCHDGTFEPDFRTVESSYNSLVFHPIVKNYSIANDGREPLPYRVTPFEPEQSMLFKRITEHFLPNFERMPSSGNPLSQDQIGLILNWINDGAKDIFGNTPTLSSTQPACYGVVAYLPDNNNFRIDTARIDNVVFNPFITSADENMEMWLLFLDMDADQNYVLGNALTYNKIQFSTEPFTFSNPVELDLQVEIIPNLINSVFSTYNQEQLPYYQKVTFKPSDLGFESGDVVYLRTFVKDADHDDPTEIPNENSPAYLIQYFSFYVQ